MAIIEHTEDTKWYKIWMKKYSLILLEVSTETPSNNLGIVFRNGNKYKFP